MNKTTIKAEIVADCPSPQGNRLTSLLITFPRIILAEVNTHRMLSKNTSSSRAIPFNKMAESVQNDPFIPLAWQKNHPGMQGTEYITDEDDLWLAKANWLRARDHAIDYASHNNKEVGVTKQLCNRLLEPFMWTTMLITGSEEGWNNFFELRCPSYDLPIFQLVTKSGSSFNSRKDAIKMFPQVESYTDLDWLKCNKGQAEIHMMTLAERIYDAMNESTPTRLKPYEWHIPFRDNIDKLGIESVVQSMTTEELRSHVPVYAKISTSLGARASYTVVGEEKEIDYKKMIDLHDRLISQNPPHSSPMEHCAIAMDNEQYYSHVKGTIVLDNQTGSVASDESMYGWCRNFRGFIQYRHLIESEKNG